MAAVQRFDIVIDQGFVKREVERIVESKLFQQLMKQRAAMKPSVRCERGERL
jgi:hypothetical protein